jgi:hypothetical protein
LKQNEAKQKQKFFRFDAKKVFFACFHIWNKTKMKWSEKKTKKKQKFQSKKG